MIGIAGAGDDHLALLRGSPESFTDPDAGRRASAASTADEVLAVLGRGVARLTRTLGRTAAAARASCRPTVRPAETVTGTPFSAALPRHVEPLGVGEVVDRDAGHRRRAAASGSPSAWWP